MVLVLLVAILALCSNADALSSSSSSVTKFTELLPLKVAMLTKNWQGLLMDVDQKVGIVPELGGSSVGIQRFGPELERRTLCARQFERVYESSFALAAADKSGTDTEVYAKRLLVPHLTTTDGDGHARGPRCKTFACLTSPATIAIVDVGVDVVGSSESDDDATAAATEWSILALTVNPTERDIATIVAAESAMLSELNTRAGGEGCSLKILAQAKETLAGDCEQLNLTPVDAVDDKGGIVWFRCEP